MRKALLMSLVHIRWAYFHVSPSYIKFKVKDDSDECYFQNIKTGEIHCNFVWTGK